MHPDLKRWADKDPRRSVQQKEDSITICWRNQGQRIERKYATLRQAVHAVLTGAY